MNSSEFSRKRTMILSSGLIALAFGTTLPQIARSDASRASEGLTARSAASRPSTETIEIASLGYRLVGSQGLLHIGFPAARHLTAAPIYSARLYALNSAGGASKTLIYESDRIPASDKMSSLAIGVALKTNESYDLELRSGNSGRGSTRFTLGVVYGKYAVHIHVSDTPIVNTFAIDQSFGSPISGSPPGTTFANAAEWDERLRSKPQVTPPPPVIYLDNECPAFMIKILQSGNSPDGMPGTAAITLYALNGGVYSPYDRNVRIDNDTLDVNDPTFLPGLVQGHPTLYYPTVDLKFSADPAKLLPPNTYRVGIKMTNGGDEHFAYFIVKQSSN